MVEIEQSDCAVAGCYTPLRPRSARRADRIRDERDALDVLGRRDRRIGVGLDTQVRRAEGRPALHSGAPRVRVALLRTQPDLDPELLAGPAGGVRGGVQPVAHLRERPGRVGIARAGEDQPRAVVDGAADCCGALAAEPDRNAAERGRIEPDVVEPLATELAGHTPLGPEPLHERDLRIEALAARVEVLTERLVPERVPANAETEPQSAAREHVDLGGLF